MYIMEGIIVLVLLIGILSQVNAQTQCDGTISGGTFSEISVSGTSCTLQGVTVTGSVSVDDGGTLTTTGNTAISGSIEATGSGNIRLEGQTSVSGSVLFTDTPSGRITIGTNAVTTSLSLENAGSAVIRGTTGGVSTKTSGPLRVAGGEIGGGGLFIEQGTGNVVLCGANVSGSVEMVETTGDLRALSSSTCAASTISGLIGVEKGTGDVRLRGVTVESGDFGVVEQTGSVEITSVTLSDISISGLSGSIVLDDVTTDSDVGLKENTGDVTVMDCSIQGDVGIENNQAVTITGSSFGLEDVGLKLNGGPVRITGNTDLSLSIEENNNVELANNDIKDASITKNTGGVVINDNTFEVLACADNNPSPIGTGNTVIAPVTGQCQSVVV